MAKLNPQILRHLEWIGFVQPSGLVVSGPALVRVGAILDRQDTEGQRLLRECVKDRAFRQGDDPEPWLPDFETFARTVLEWNFSPRGYAGSEGNPVPNELQVMTGDGELLAPDFAVRERSPGEGESAWQLLVQELEPGQDFDKEVKGSGALEASPHSRMERLLRRTEVKAGLLFNGLAIRLISAPRGESSGWMDFRVAEMVQTSGRPICAALRLLLRQSRLLSVPGPQRLAALLEDSRKFQNEVSERLAEQVLHALYEMLRGFQAAHDASTNRNLLRQTLAENPDRVYHALLTVLLRLVFLLYAEERDMLPKGEIFQQYYSLVGLYKRLREDAALFPDTMDQRYGAWAQLLVLFRLIHDGGEAREMRLPRRHGVLFDPDRFPFLEGRMVARQIGERIEPPLVSDGTIYRALEKLLVLDGERISYRALDVEQIGSVYETMMGFRLETASGRSVAIKAAKKQGAPTAVDLDALVVEPGAKREKWLRDRTDRRLGDKVKKVVKEAETVEDLHAALLPVIEVDATPDLVPQGAMVLQPSEERRRSGSHYTPRELTEPIVRRTLEPIWARMQGESGKAPRPEQILDLKVCDPAMGSGAFLVEACRQLGDALVEAWRAHGEVPEIPPDEDEGIFARRLIAQRCLYGVDRNPMAVDLAKVSLWLVTLARDHALTFVDHALRHGDSLVGLSRKQIEAFHWKEEMLSVRAGFETMMIHQQMEKVADLRRRIREAGETTSDRELQLLWMDARDELDEVTLFGDLVLEAFFEGDKPKKRETKRTEFANVVASGDADCYRGWLAELREQDPPLAPFHWELEFPEVFERDNSGFDAIVGNPPFAGKNTVTAGNVDHYPDWLKQMHEQSHGNADLVAHFFRRAFNLVRETSAFGLIATNTIAQGDTRSTGLRWICENGGIIYDATRRCRWPGQAAVVVSVIHIHRGTWDGPRRLDGDEVSDITAFLFHGGGHDDPARLEANVGKSFQGCIMLGMGFTFDDTDKKGIATSLAEMRWLIEAEPRNREAIFPYIGGEEINTSPTHACHRYVINFRDYPLRRENLGRQWVDADKNQRREWLQRGIVPLDYPSPVAADWPELLAIVEDRVKPQREALPQKNSINRDAARNWWRFLAYRQGLHAAIANLERVLAISRVSQQVAFTFLPTDMVHADSTVVFPFDTYAAFCSLQSRLHEIWARFFGSSLEERFRYTPSDCFETFPFLKGWVTYPVLKAAGETYYEFRAQLMVANNEGMTKTYNRFHDPSETGLEIAKFRELHAAMDRAVLDAYGWDDIPIDCEFLLDYEIDEEEWGNRKKPYRYRWPDEVRDEVLARLLELNAQRPKRETGTKPSFWEEDDEE